MVDMSVAVTIFDFDYGASSGSFDEFIPAGCSERGLTTPIYGAIIAITVRMALTLTLRGGGTMMIVVDEAQILKQR